MNLPRLRFIVVCVYVCCCLASGCSEASEGPLPGGAEGGGQCEEEGARAADPPAPDSQPRQQALLLQERQGGHGECLTF